MAPSLFSLKSLRRRSKASFRTDRSTDTSSEGEVSVSHGTTPTSGFYTPPSLSQKSDDALSLKVKDQPSGSLAPPRPPLSGPSQSMNRMSVAGSINGTIAALGNPSAHGSRTHLPLSPYAPRVTNLTDGCWAYQKVLLVHGTIGEPGQRLLDGTLTICRADDAFPPIPWPVWDSQWKALVYLQPGPNRLRFDFSNPKLGHTGSSPSHSTLMVHMMPPMNAPPLHLAILLGSDSPGTFDAVPARAEREGNGIDIAVRKFRMAAYLWQAFTAEQMWRNKLGRRTFRFDEEWITGTANMRDREMGTMRSEAKVHIIRTDRTVEELRDIEKAQQNPNASNKGALFDIAKRAVTKYFQLLEGQKLHVSVLLLDSHWDTASQIIIGHAALGGGAGDLRLAIFGSHCLQSYPSSFEEVVPAFTDCTPTDKNYVANDCNEAGSSWEMANIGIGAHLHETGHLFGCPHQESGIMLRDYVRLNRSFVSREAFSTRTKSKGGVVSRDQECSWHRLDCLRFRSHPCFKLPSDPPMNPDDSIHAWPVDGVNVVISAATGVTHMELYADGDGICHSWIEFPSETPGSQVPRSVTLSESDLRSRLPEAKQQGNLRVSVKSCGGGNLDIDDFHRLVSAKESTVKLENGRTAFMSQRLGLSNTPGSTPSRLIFTSAERASRVLSRVVVYHGAAVDGIEFSYDDDSSQLFGKRGGKPGGDNFELDIRRGEYITGFHLRSGAWVDAIQILTSLGRRSPLYGNHYGGSATTLIPPRGFGVVGVAGSCGSWLDSFSVLIAR